MKIRELNHVAIHVGDVEKSCRFYREVLRLESMPRPAFTFPGAWFPLPGEGARIKVLRDTAQRQIPWVNTSMVVNFMFNPGPAPGLAGPKRNLQLLVQAQRSLSLSASSA